MTAGFYLLADDKEPIRLRFTVSRQFCAATLFDLLFPLLSPRSARVAASGVTPIPELANTAGEGCYREGGTVSDGTYCDSTSCPFT